jgi:hypothetical protein
MKITRFTKEALASAQTGDVLAFGKFPYKEPGRRSEKAYWPRVGVGPNHGLGVVNYDPEPTFHYGSTWGEIKAWQAIPNGAQTPKFWQYGNTVLMGGERAIVTMTQDVTWPLLCTAHLIDFSGNAKELNPGKIADSGSCAEYAVLASFVNDNTEDEAAAEQEVIVVDWKTGETRTLEIPLDPNFRVKGVSRQPHDNHGDYDEYYNYPGKLSLCATPEGILATHSNHKRTDQSRTLLLDPATGAVLGDTLITSGNIPWRPKGFGEAAWFVKHDHNWFYKTHNTGDLNGPLIHVVTFSSLPTELCSHGLLVKANSCFHLLRSGGALKDLINVDDLFKENEVNEFCFETKAYHPDGIIIRESTHGKEQAENFFLLVVKE